ncbi:MAG: M15 family metallopeptidase [Mycobacteriales bacterium]
MTELVDPAELGLVVEGQPPLPSCADDASVRRVDVFDNGEPLVPVRGRLNVIGVYRRMGLANAPEHAWLRSGVLDRLVAVDAALPRPFGLVVLDGWRSRAFQQDLLSFYRRIHRSELSGYVADPEDSTVIPPHVTGGAVDLTLTGHGVPLALGSAFDDFSERAHLAALESRPDDLMVARLRQLLAAALTAQRFAPYRLEWWHWSFGDQQWAAQWGLDRSLYGPATDPPRRSATAAQSR